MVTSWLLNSLSKDITYSVIYLGLLKISRSVWSTNLDNPMVPNCFILDLLTEFDVSFLPSVYSPMDPSIKLSEKVSQPRYFFDSITLFSLSTFYAQIGPLVETPAGQSVNSS